jgi:hypothetical protein
VHYHHFPHRNGRNRPDKSKCVDHIFPTVSHCYLPQPPWKNQKDLLDFDFRCPMLQSWTDPSSGQVRKSHLETYSNWVCDVTENEVGTAIGFSQIFWVSMGAHKYRQLFLGAHFCNVSIFNAKLHISIY